MNHDVGAQARHDQLHAQRELPQRWAETVSALVDGEMKDPQAHVEALGHVARDPQARQAWLQYHQVGDWLRCAQWAPDFDDHAFLERFGQRLRSEPVQLAPAMGDAWRGARRRGTARRATWSVACAGVAALLVLQVGGALPNHDAPWLSERAPVQAAGPDMLGLAAAVASAGSQFGTRPSQAVSASVVAAALGPGAARRRALALDPAYLQPLHGHAPSRLHVAR